ncbi:MAG: hypothetical protein WC488_00270 [Candidatus Micrarchaeia archaeon]
MPMKKNKAKPKKNEIASNEAPSNPHEPSSFRLETSTFILFLFAVNTILLFSVTSPAELTYDSETIYDVGSDYDTRSNTNSQVQPQTGEGLVPKGVPPSVSITSPANNQAYFNPVSLAYSIGNSPTSCYYKLDNSVNHQLQYCAGGSISLSTLSPGAHSVSVYASNKYGTGLRTVNFYVNGTG